jgi:hypothetical protein
MTAMQEFVVPKSMPNTFAIKNSFDKIVGTSMQGKCQTREMDLKRFIYEERKSFSRRFRLKSFQNFAPV